MKILLINDFGSLQGGAEVQIVALRNGLRERGHDARLFTTRASNVNLPILSDYQCFGTTSSLRTVTQVANLSAYKTLRVILHDFNPDLVHIRVMLWQISPIILSLLSDYPTIFNVADYKTHCPRAKKILPDGRACKDQAGVACLKNRCFSSIPQWGFEMMQQSLWQHYQSAVNCVVAQSDGSRVYLEELGLHVDTVIHNGVVDKPQRPSLTSRPTVAYTGRLSWEKGLTTLAHAFQQTLQKNPHVQLLVIGSGTDKRSLQQLFDKLNIKDNTTLIDHIDPSELDHYLSEAWLQVVPSIWQEPFPNVATEAMMRGTAIVASRIGGLQDIVEQDVTGYLVDTGDASALSEAITKLLSNRERAETMGQKARDRALTHFPMSRTIDNFEALYNEVIL